ncbi:MAG TPA: hypothetical protein PK096_00485 [Candidatus Saccharibacteria bacterium]|nr:hypothetical protein [Candidatus Saccharibacteria bacterium]HRK93833.1 hypothetical protein [Candidatus Saccharibacteria bacterium]
MATLQQQYANEDTFWRRWLAVFILAVFFILSWGGQYFSQLEQVKQQSEEHGQTFQMSEFWPEFWSATFENWQSEWLQLVTQAILIAALADYLFRKGNQDHYKTQLMIEELRKDLKSRRK